MWWGCMLLKGPGGDCGRGFVIFEVRSGSAGREGPGAGRSRRTLAPGRSALGVDRTIGRSITTGGSSRTTWSKRLHAGLYGNSDMSAVSSDTL